MAGTNGQCQILIVDPEIAEDLKKKSRLLHPDTWSLSDLTKM